MLLDLLILFSLFTRGFSQAITNTLSAWKNTAGDTMIFNIQKNGVNVFETEQVVTSFDESSPSTFDFQRELSDVIEVIFSQASEYPGKYTIRSNYDSGNVPIFSSGDPDFFPVNQCLSSQCLFRISPIDSFPEGITASVLINGIATTISGYNGDGDSQTISIQKGQFINVKLSSSSDGSVFGMNLITTEGSQQTTIPWYNGNLATQMLIPSVYLTLPLDGVTIYPNTNLPVELISYPLPNTFQVTLTCGNRSQNPQIESNDGIQTFLITIDVSDGQQCTLTAGIESDTNLYTSLNIITAIGSDTIPDSIDIYIDNIRSLFSAGSSVPIQLTASPDEPGNFMVQLACGTLEPAINLITSNSTAQNFTIPDTFYGSDCIFSVIYPIAATENQQITVTQPVEFSSPTSGAIYNINSLIRVTPSADATIPNQAITVRQVCGSSEINYNNVAVNANFNAKPPLNYAGQCIFSSLVSGLYEAAFPTVAVTILNRIFFSQVPTQLINTQPSFVVKINSLGAPVSGSTIATLELNCQVLGLVESWPVTLNSIVTLALNRPELTSGPYRCTLSTSSSSFYNQVSSNLTLLTQITPAEFSNFIQANGFTPAAGWIVP